MRILHYMFGIPPVRGGGLIRYASDLMGQERAMGHDVRLLVPGAVPGDSEKKTRIYRLRKDYMNVPSYAVYNPLPVPMCSGILDIAAYTKKCSGKIYADFLRRIKPDVIHVHTLMGLHREFLEEAQKLDIPAVFTSHDYFGICPAAHMMSAGGICRDKDWKMCGLCCRNAYSKRRLRLEQSGIYRFYRRNRWMVHILHKGMLKNCFQALRASGAGVQHMRAETSGIKKSSSSEEAFGLKDYSALKQYYEGMFQMVSCFHFNSTLAGEIYRARLGGVKGSVVNISHAGISGRRKKRSYGKILRIGYFGGWVEYKGFFVLLGACREIYQEGCRGIELHLYSDTEERKEAFVTNHRSFRREQLEQALGDIDLLVLPSVCPETFGLAALEAVSCGVPAVISENAGAKDILRENPGIGFVYDGSLRELKKCLRGIYEDRSLLERANACILDMDYDFSYEAHVEKILDLYSRLLH